MKPTYLIASVLVVLSTKLVADVTCKESDDRIVITRNGKHVLTYNKSFNAPVGLDKKYERSGFIHPISTPSGRVITDGYPMPHHTHQNGLFFAWRKASFKDKSLNFWEPSEATVRHEKVLEIINKQNSAGFRVMLAHVNGKQKILQDEWTVTVNSDTGYIDLKSEQACATDFPLTLERFHYGGMAIRGSRQWFPSARKSAGKGALKDEFVELCQIITSDGLTKANGNHSRPKWLSMTGPVDAAPVSITFVPHPSNFRYPQHVRLHPNIPYFCFIPTVEKPFKIEHGKPFVSRYRIVAEDGKPMTEKLDAIQRLYATEK